MAIRKVISQREARRLKQRVVELERLEYECRSKLIRDYPRYPERLPNNILAERLGAIASLVQVATVTE